ncbi:hypothetical protein MNBD_GAMMA26-11 [hydrothermal vent metagenome]|uniref:Polysaccharide chain length determinant N-terminal domain-containing protein n=1 Tax=hydrothermal vent metagenome TaxID=652676 RepID=A0A3B1BM31_9ZZZZ
MNMNTTSPGVSLSARDILTVVFKQKKTFISIIAFTTALVSLGAYILPLPQKAEAKIYVDRSKINMVPGISQYGLRYLEREEILNTEIEVILSRPVAEKVVDQLSLDIPSEEHSFFNDASKSFSNFTAKIGLTYEISLRASAISNVQSKIKVKPIPKSNIIKISYLGTDPKKITSIVNAVANAYIGTRKKLNKPKGLRSFYASQVALFKEELDDLNKRDYMLRSKWSVNELDLERQSVVAEFSELKKELDQNRSEYTTMQTRIYNMQKSGDYIPFDTNVKRYLAIDQMGTYLLDLELARNKIILMYKAGNSKIRNAESEVMSLKGEILKSLISIKNELETKIANLENSLLLLEKKKSKLNDQESILSEIAVAKKVAGKSYLSYKGLEEQARLSDISENEGLNVLVLSYATQPEAPIFSRFVFISVGFIFSIFAAFGAALLLEYFNHLVDTPEDIEYFSELKVVAIIPDIKEVIFSSKSG